MLTSQGWSEAYLIYLSSTFLSQNYLFPTDVFGGVKDNTLKSVYLEAPRIFCPFHRE